MLFVSWIGTFLIMIGYYVIVRSDNREVGLLLEFFGSLLTFLYSLAIHEPSIAFVNAFFVVVSVAGLDREP